MGTPTTTDQPAPIRSFCVTVGFGPLLHQELDYWQVGYVIPKGTFPELRHEGIESLRRSFTELIPEFADRLEHLGHWEQVSLLSVESSRCPRWYRRGLLLIADAAHVMSLVGGRRARLAAGQ